MACPAKNNFIFDINALMEYYKLTKPDITMTIVTAEVEVDDGNLQDHVIFSDGLENLVECNNKKRNSNSVAVYDSVSHAEVELEESIGKMVDIPKKKSVHFTCSSCSYTSFKRYMVKRHMITHSEERPYQCQICKNAFKIPRSLQIHMDTHNGVKPHKCESCTSQFTTAGELLRHERYKHTLEKRFKCLQCDYACVEQSKLQRHIRSHTGERPYQCELCTYRSLDTFKLTRHMRTHTGEKPYKCEHCNVFFAQSNTLKAHKLTHDSSARSVFTCNLCPAKYGRMLGLRHHIQNWHTSSDQPLKCKRCRKSFPDRYSYKIHNKKH